MTTARHSHLLPRNVNVNLDLPPRQFTTLSVSTVYNKSGQGAGRYVSEQPVLSVPVPVAALLKQRTLPARALT